MDGILFFLGIDFCEANECDNPHIKWSITIFYDFLQWKHQHQGKIHFFALFRIYFWIGGSLKDYIRSDAFK